jgi:hypothetical protein
MQVFHLLSTPARLPLSPLVFLVHFIVCISRAAIPGLMVAFAKASFVKEPPGAYICTAVMGNVLVFLLTAQAL